jgi:TIR domain/NACHT domain
MAQPSVFISYSHKDEKWRELFVRHLGVLEREDLLSVWSDRRIEAGGDWQREIEQALAQARVAVLLISADFLTSDFILGEEIPQILKRRSQDGLRLVPVIVRPCTWDKVKWLQPMQARPLEGRALASFKPADRKETEVVKIVKEILGFLEDRAERPGTFVEVYRRAFSSLYSRWDLGSVGVAQSGGAGEPIVADLDHMYLPLRLGEGYDIRQTNRGMVLGPAELLARNRPLVIRGAAGSGKTTWMRWTFRRLLDPALDALPVMVVLRDLAARWKDRTRQGAERSLDAFLEAAVAQHLPGWEGHLSRQLEAVGGPRPVLLVDGWDEVGPLGEELRQKLLGFVARHPHVLVVVTSRPYGEGRPSHSEGFDLLDIQPLSDEEIGGLAARFFARCHGADEVIGRRDAERFQRSLERAPEPQALARTALLLTMMLLIARSKPLPDKRHLLYEECIKNLLTALPDRKEEEGALTLREQWRPGDSEERMRVVADLAYRLKAGDRRESWRRDAAIVGSWDEMAALLPEHWPLPQRKGFLAWLTGPAGLLTDRVDDTLTFTHLSFQEYLTAWHLDATVEGAERVNAFWERLAATDWWETLRLWAAFLHRQSPARLEPVLAALGSAKEGGLALAGCLFADDLGSEEQFEAWLARLSEELVKGWPRQMDFCGRAWAASRQEARRDRFAASVAACAAKASWLTWLRCEEVRKVTSLEGALPLPEGLLYRAAIQQVYDEVDEPAGVAASRLWSGGPSIWPAAPLTLGLLQAWPAERRIVGARLQLAAAVGASRNDINHLAVTIAQPDTKTDINLARDLARDLAPDLSADWTLGWARDWTRYSARDLACYLARYWSRDWARDWARRMAEFWIHYLPRNMKHYRTHNWDRDFARDLALRWAGYCVRGLPAGDMARDWVCDLAERAGLNHEQPWIEHFASIDLASSGRAGARAQLAGFKGNYILREATVLAAACCLALHPPLSPTAFEDTVADYAINIDPLWPALARHLARRSTTEDRALLIDLASQPELREPPLRWGLQFIVRGDVMLEDGSVVTLDELTDEAGLPRLPFLDEMPDELEVDWDEPEKT